MPSTRILALAAAFVFVMPAVHAQDQHAATIAQINPMAGDSSALRLSDAELDQIAAGTFSLNFVANSGSANILKPEPSHTVCVNCAGATDRGAQVLIFVQNPAQTLLKCVHIAC
jgi:hypothetical protein